MKKSVLDTFKIYKSLTRHKILNFQKFNHYAIVHHSNSIEGSTLTLEETELLLDEKLTPAAKPMLETNMALDHYQALKYVTLIANNKTLLSIKIIKEISALIMKNTGGHISSMGGDFDSSKGEFRKLNVRAGNTTFINYDKVENYVKELLEYINKNIKTVKTFKEVNELAFDFHYQMVSIHPFSDGNGRISRLMMNYVQQYHDLPLTVIYNNDKLQYYKSLTNTRKEANIIYFYDFMFDQTEKYLLAQNKILQQKLKRNQNKKGMSFLF